MKANELAAEMRRRQDPQASCDGCPVSETCLELREDLCNFLAAALVEAGVVPVVTAPGEKKERTETK